MESDIDKMLADFGLAGYENKYPHELSGGMRQRVAFLRTTLLGEDILLLDEPFSSLDAITKLHMQEWLLSKWEKNKSTIVFITHDISEAIFLSDRIFVIGEQPITSLEAIEVPLPRPRKWTDVDKPGVIDLKHNLIRRFRTKVNL